MGVEDGIGGAAVRGGTIGDAEVTAVDHRTIARVHTMRGVILRGVANAVGKLENYRIGALCVLAPAARLIAAGQKKMQLDIGIDLLFLKHLERSDSVKSLRAAAPEIEIAIGYQSLKQLVKLSGEQNDALGGNMPMPRKHTDLSFHSSPLSPFCFLL